MKQYKNYLSDILKKVRILDILIQISTILIIGGIFIIFVFFVGLSKSFTICGDIPIVTDVTGQVGDFIGGVVGTIFTLVGNLLLFYTLKLQRESIKSQSSEFTFNTITTILFNQQELVEKKFAGAIFYKECEKGFLGLFEVSKVDSTSFYNHSIYQKLSENKTDTLLDFYNESLAILIFLIEKKEKGIFVLSQNERYNFYLLIKLNFHTVEMKEFLEKNKRDNYVYSPLIETLDAINTNANNSYQSYTNQI